jgi:hypothetical protein
VLEPRKGGALNVRIELGINVSIPENQKIGIENLTNSIEGMELNKLVTKKIIEECQDVLVDELCGPRYSGNGEKGHKRAGKSKRTIGTRFGKVKGRS